MDLGYNCWLVEAFCFGTIESRLSWLEGRPSTPILQLQGGSWSPGRWNGLGKVTQLWVSDKRVIPVHPLLLRCSDTTCPQRLLPHPQGSIYSSFPKWQPTVWTALNLVLTGGSKGTAQAWCWLAGMTRATRDKLIQGSKWCLEGIQSCFVHLASIPECWTHARQHSKCQGKAMTTTGMGSWNLQSSEKDTEQESEAKGRSSGCYRRKASWRRWEKLSV